MAFLAGKVRRATSRFREDKVRRGPGGQFADKPGAPEAGGKRVVVVPPHLRKESNLKDGDVLALQVSTNPRKKGTPAYDRHEKYRTGMTVGEYVEAVKDTRTKAEALSDLYWARQKGHLQFVDKKDAGVLAKLSDAGAASRPTSGNPGTPQFKLPVAKAKVVKKGPSAPPENDVARWAKAPVVESGVHPHKMEGEARDALMRTREVSGVGFVSGYTNSSVSHYTGSGYSALNKNLRFNKPLTDTQKTVVKDLDALVAGSTFKDDVVMWRGVGYEKISKMPPPPSLADSGFVSVSYAPRVSAGFAAQTEGPDGVVRTTLFRIRVPKGTPGIHVGRRATMEESLKDEAEVLLERGTTFHAFGRRVVEMPDGATYNVIDAIAVRPAESPSLSSSSDDPPDIYEGGVPNPGRARPGWTKARPTGRY